MFYIDTSAAYGIEVNITPISEDGLKERLQTRDPSMSYKQMLG